MTSSPSRVYGVITITCVWRHKAVIAGRKFEILYLLFNLAEILHMGQLLDADLEFAIKKADIDTI